MPIYEYQCAKCGEVKEIITSTYQHVEWCKKCGSEMTRTVSTGTNFILKGEGWYEKMRTDKPD